eukprot:EG_transcript_6662
MRRASEELFAEWIGVCCGRGHGDGSPAAVVQQQAMAFIGKLQQRGMLRAVGVMEAFFAALMRVSVAQFARAEGEAADSAGQACFREVDAFSDLIVLLVKCCGRGQANRAGDAAASPNVLAEVALLTKAMGVVSRLLLEAHDAALAALVDASPAAPPAAPGFSQRPYFRFFSNLLLALCQSSSEEQPPPLEVLAAFGHTFHALSPLRAPGFAGAWLELLSHRLFLPKLLLTKQQDGWPHFQRLLLCALRFLEPSLREARLSEPVRFLYRGLLRVLLVLLHDFPEFLCSYHFALCDAMAPTCIQMRNIVLSAFPRHMRLPDPFTPNLKVDLLPEVAQPPRILSKVVEQLRPSPTFVPPVPLPEVDAYLQTRSPPTWPASLAQRLVLPPAQAATAGTRYDVPAINALVLYVGATAISQLQHGPTPVTASAVDCPAMDVYRALATDLDVEGRYAALNALANQLRYPNTHTHYFSCVVLHLFGGLRPEHPALQEQITRVLLERLIVNRPHPWGLLITFIELVKNPHYDFWKKPFIHCTPEIERLFDSVGQSCSNPPASRSSAPAPASAAAAGPSVG